MFKLEKLPTSKRLHRPRFVLSTSSTPSHAPDMPPLRPEFLNGIITAATPQGSSDLPFYECPPDMIQPHSYRAARPDLPTLKEMILSNANALFSHTYPTAADFDVVTSSRTSSGRLDSLTYRAALIAYLAPEKNRDWRMLYQSNPCSTVEDALFEIKYWIEEDLDEVFESMRAGDERLSGPDGKGDGIGRDTSTYAEDGDGGIVKNMLKREGKPARKRVGEVLQAKFPKRMRDYVGMSG